MKKMQINLKSNKGFTIQDVSVAIIIMVIFVGAITTSLINIFKMQSETKLTAVTTMYGIQILENIDKISYEEVVNGMEDHYKTLFGIPEQMNLQLEVSNYNTENTIKKIDLTITYTFDNRTEELLLQSIKVKEV